MYIEIVPYNPKWKELYRRESEAILGACGEFILTIEHAGSTSVEGLAAKPIVDIYIGTRSLDQSDSIIESMRSLGYEYVKEFEDDLPFRRYFRKEINGKRTFHVHVTAADHEFRNIDLIFRDYVSINNEAKKEYEELKLNLSKKGWAENESYTKAKTETCLRIKSEALKHFGEKFESTEAEATYQMFLNAPPKAVKRTGFSLLHENGVTAIRADIFEGFSLNRVLGISEIDEKFLDKIEKFYKGKPGKFALQIPPGLIKYETKQLLDSRGYEYSNSWVTFYRDTSPSVSRGTEFGIREIGPEYAADYGRILNEVFAFPQEFDEITSCTLGRKNWITFMAFDGNKPAGSASVYISGENGYLSFGNVLPEYRNKGIQGELLTRRINAARVRGVKWLFVDTGETSEENHNPSYWNILRKGFRLMYHRPNYVKIQ
jgi:GrpB-like predicted nucleotidyltransferase (UPF0157 family)/GNAT superfamily N-acetyltransferase